METQSSSVDVAAVTSAVDWRWRQIDDDLREEAACALRIGENLIALRDALKPHGLWLSELLKHGMSQPQASRYIRYASLPQADRATFQRARGFSLSEAIGERRRKSEAIGDHSPTNSPPVAPDEVDDRLAEVDRLLRLGGMVIDAGAEAHEGEPMLHVAVDALRAVCGANLRAELTRRLLPGAPCD